MKPKVLQLLEQCVEIGTARGWNRAHKHVEDPDAESIQSMIQTEVMAEIHEWFNFDETDL